MNPDLLTSRWTRWTLALRTRFVAASQRERWADQSVCHEFDIQAILVGCGYGPLSRPRRVHNLSGRLLKGGRRSLFRRTRSRTHGQGVQDIDRPNQIQALSEPAGASRPRGDTKALRVVTRAESLDGIIRYRRRRRHLR